jgi:hypothetical protein
MQPPSEKGSGGAHPIRTCSLPVREPFEHRQHVGFTEGILEAENVQAIYSSRKSIQRIPPMM